MTDEPNVIRLEGDMYSMVFPDEHRISRYQTLLPMLQPINPGRFRDAWVEVQDGKVVIALYTRNGGGNREHYTSEDVEAGINCTCTGCIATYHLPSHPDYLYDEDMEFDSTYATFYFKIPDSQPAWIVDALRDVAEPEKVNMAERWQEAIANLGG